MGSVGLIRVSRVRGREGESFISPVEQADKIRSWCARENLRLLDILEELDVSGGASLEDRPGLTAALNLIEAGDADTLVVAYFDRLFRSTRVQAEVLERIEKAGGRVFALDAGEVTGTTDGQWLQSGFLGLMAEYQRRQVKGRMAESQARAIARGVATWDVNLPGYRKRPDGVLEPDELAPVIRQAFRMRYDGTTIKEVRLFLRSHGIDRSYHGTSCLLASRVYLGELHFGQHHNLTAHEPIVDRDLWNAVQRTKISRGRRAKSDRLLARLGVLRCGTCGSRMIVGSSHHGQYPIYRCPPVGDCDRRQSISATIAEKVVVDAVLEAIGSVEGRAAAVDHAREARVALDRAQADLDAALRAFTGLESEPAAIERLGELRAIRDNCLAEVDHLSRDLTPSLTITTADWPELTLDGQRAIIKTTVQKVTVSPGRGVDRLTVTLFEH